MLYFPGGPGEPDLEATRWKQYTELLCLFCEMSHARYTSRPQQRWTQRHPVSEAWRPWFQRQPPVSCHVSVSTLVSSLCHTDECRCAKTLMAPGFTAAGSDGAGAPRWPAVAANSLDHLARCARHIVHFFTYAFFGRSVGSNGLESKL